jgi:hypothetical protein
LSYERCPAVRETSANAREIAHDRRKSVDNVLWQRSSMAFHGRVDARLVRAARRMADLSSAEAWRRLSPLARRLGVRRPSYQTVRRLLVLERELRQLRRARRRVNETLLADLLAGKVPWTWLHQRIAGAEPG